MSIHRARYFPAFILLAVMLSGTIVLGAGQTLHVSPSGNDANSCGQTLPCREIRRALELAGPGDTILVANGTYKGFNVADRHGLAGSPITIKAQGTSAVVEKTTDRSDNRDTIFITFSSYIVVDGLRSFDANRGAVRIDESPHITVRNCVFGNNAKWGIFTDFSDDLLIEGNETYGSVTEHGIYVSNSGDRPIVRGNRSHDNRGAGIQLNADVFAGGDGIITGALVENNVLYNNGVGGGAAINLDGVQDSVIRNNLMYNNYATGIALFQGNGAEGPKGNKVDHNTIHQASNGRWALLMWRSAGPNTLRNNILYHPSSARGGINYLDNVDVSNTNSDYNVLDRITPDDGGTVYTLDQWKGLGHETHSISASPASLFVNAAGANFHLAASSPAIDRGVTLAEVTRDIEGTPRPVGAASDIGAYEAGAATPTPVLSVSDDTVPPGAPVQVVVSNGPGSRTDWVGLYRVGTADTAFLDWKYLSDSRTPPGTPLTGATLNFNMPLAPETYEFRFFASNGYTRLATSPPVTVEGGGGGSPSLSVSDNSVPPGGPVQVLVTDGPGNLTDWVGLYRQGTGDTAFLDWKYLSGGRTPPGTPLTGATLNFNVPLAPETYEFRFFASNGYTRLATSPPVTVEGGGGGSPSLSVSDNSVPPGGPVQVVVSNGPGNLRDWVGLYRVGTADTAFLDWKYLSDGRTPPGTPLAGATLNFTMPATPETYEFRFFANNGFARLATGPPVSVVP